MLETLVPSRIRRTLLEYLLQYPAERFYLRGLARQLELPITPLRRELKRLESTGVLTSTPEGNMRFYAVKNAAALTMVFPRMVAVEERAAAPVVRPPVRMGVARMAMFALVGVWMVGMIIGAGSSGRASRKHATSSATMESSQWRISGGGFTALSAGQTGGQVR